MLPIMPTVHDERYDKKRYDG